MKDIKMWHQQTRPMALAILWTMGAFLAVALAVQCGCASYAVLEARARPMQLQDQTAVLVEELCIDDDTFVAPTMGFTYSAKRGSGVIIDARHVLTAYHVVTCPYLPDVHVTLANGKRYKMNVDKEWRDRDVARLELSAAGPDFGNVAPPIIAPIKIGLGGCSSVAWPHRAGNCGTIDEQVTMHCVTLTNGHRWCEDTLVTAKVDGGNSGGPFYDETGALVGIVTAGLFDLVTNQPTGQGFISSLWDIRSEL